jgi:hypothetical protein
MNQFLADAARYAFSPTHSAANTLDLGGSNAIDPRVEQRLKALGYID